MTSDMFLVRKIGGLFININSGLNGGFGVVVVL
jgi:hypothetical protein